MKTAVLFALVLAGSLSVGKDSNRLSLEACKANATPELSRLALTTVYDGPVTRRDGTTVALFRDTEDARALSCITNPAVPTNVQQVWARALAEVVQHRYQMDLEEAAK